MKATRWAWLAAAGFGLLAACIAGVRHDAPAAPEARQAASPGKHFVAPADLTASGISAHQRIRPFTATAHDGRPLGLADLTRGKPLVLLFIKSGCPCSVEFEPFFHRLEQAYRGQTAFAAVLDGLPDAARRYAEANQVPYPVLADARLEVIRQFQVTKGASVALVTPDGFLDALWPGCSEEMMRELGRRLADLAGVAEVGLDCSGMPHALTAGCPYEW
jgi:peroxiredoxin